VTIVYPLAPGGGADLFLRAITREMQALMGQPVLVESRPGGGGLIAGAYVARAKPDGYTIGDLQSTQVIPEVFAAFRKPPYATEDLKFAVRVFYLPSALVSKADAPWRTMREFVKYVQDNPGRINFAQTVGDGHPQVVLTGLIFQENRMQVMAVPFKVGRRKRRAARRPRRRWLSACHCRRPGHVQAGKMSILAVDSKQRISSLPDVPTLKELGFDFGMAPSYHVFAVRRGHRRRW